MLKDEKVKRKRTFKTKKYTKRTKERRKLSRQKRLKPMDWTKWKMK